MKLKIYDSNNCRSANSFSQAGVRSIGANATSGAVSFSALLSRGLKLGKGDSVYFAQDEDSGEWYISKTDNANGFAIHEKKNGGWAKDKKSVTMYFCSRMVVAKLLAACKVKKAATFLVSEKPTEADGQKWYKIVISKPLRAE